MNSGKVLADPAWIPHALNGDDVVLIHVAPDRVRRAAFLDGREPVGSDVHLVGRAAFIAARADWRTAPLPTILHVSFCGSTLLARLLDGPHTLVYREPAIQIELANRVRAGEPLEQLTLAMTAALARPVGAMRTVVKPSNWASNLLPLWAKHRAIDPIFVTMSAEAFLTAVFRGGRDRIAFTMRVAQHLAAGMPGGRALVQAAIDAHTDPLRRAAALTLTALALQCRLMADARLRFGSGSGSIIDASDIAADPLKMAIRAAGQLGIDADWPDRSLDQHAKGGGSFSPAAESRRNREVAALNKATFDAALEWAVGIELNFIV